MKGDPKEALVWSRKLFVDDLATQTCAHSRAVRNTRSSSQLFDCSRILERGIENQRSLLFGCSRILERGIENQRSLLFEGSQEVERFGLLTAEGQRSVRSWKENIGLAAVGLSGNAPPKCQPKLLRPMIGLKCARDLEQLPFSFK